MEHILTQTLQTRKLLLDFLDTIAFEDLMQVPKGFNNNIYWNIAHVVATQQLLIYNLSGVDMLLPEAFIEAYRKGTKPKALVDAAEIEFVKEALFSTIRQTKADVEAGTFTNYNPYTTSAGVTISNLAQAMSYNFYHEGLHFGSVLALRRALQR